MKHHEGCVPGYCHMNCEIARAGEANLPEFKSEEQDRAIRATGGGFITYQDPMLPVHTDTENSIGK